MLLRWLAPLVSLLLLAVACSADPDLATVTEEATSPATTGPDASTSTTPPTTTDPPTTTSPEPTPTTVAPVEVDCAATPPLAEPDPQRPVYDVQVSIDPLTGAVEGALSVVFTPDLDTDRLVFRLWPNSPRVVAGGGSIVPGPVEIAGEVTESAQLDPTTLEVILDQPLRAGESIAASLPFTVTVPEGSESRVSRSGDSLWLGSGFPILPWEPGVGWATDPPTAIYAEAAVSPVADYRVAITVPEGFDVLASGQPDEFGVWSGEAIRDFAISVGRFDTETVVVDAPDPIEVTIGVHAGMAEDPAAYAEKAAAVLEQFSADFGPYPWETLTIAIVPGIGGGIEFPTHIMQGPDSLGRILSHEIGHMLFYSLVGNNQGRDPWLDEGLASLLEARFEGTRASFEARFIPLDAAGMTGAPMTYWDDHGSSYYGGVYVQGANAVEALGDDDQVDCILRWYLAANAYGIATPEDLALIAEQVVPDARLILAEYGALDG